MAENGDRLSEEEIRQRVKAAFAPYHVEAVVTQRNGLTFGVFDFQKKRSEQDTIDNPDLYRTASALEELLATYRSTLEGKSYKFDPWP